MKICVVGVDGHMFDPLKVTVMTWGLFFNDRMRTPNKTKTKKFNIAPEAWWLEDDILSYWEGNFSGANVKLRGCKKKTDTYTHLKLNIYTQKIVLFCLSCISFFQKFSRHFGHLFVPAATGGPTQRSHDLRLQHLAWCFR